MRYSFKITILITLILTIFSIPVWAIGETNDEFPPAEIINNEGGTVVIHGSVNYTNAFFTLGTSEPLILLEDQTGFVQRDRNYILPIASQQLGQITSDFSESPFTYSLSLPIQPQAPLNDVDNNGQDDTGVMIFQIAYWNNTFGDAFLEERDLFGGGWSGAYASADVSSSVENRGEYIGGSILIYAPVDGQAFPNGFGNDEMLFTDDDPLVIVPQGYTLVNMDAETFTFDRTHDITLDLIEGEGAQPDDFSELNYVEAFTELVEKFRLEYAFTEYYNLDWDALYDQYIADIEEANNTGNRDLFSLTLQDFLWNIPDGHISMSLTRATFEQTVFNTDGGLGFAVRQLDDGAIITTFITEDSPANQAGIELQAEITSINGIAIEEALIAVQPYSAPFSTDHVRRLQQLRYITRYPIGTEVEITFRNPTSMSEQSATLTASPETESFEFSSFEVDRSGYELPVEYGVVDDYLQVSITSFSDDDRLSIQLWERMLEQAVADEIPAIIIDMRSNGGGSGYLADQMAAYFFQDPLELGNAGIYDEGEGGFYFDPESADVFILPPEELRYDGEVVVLVGPSCQSACEFFSWNMTVANRATIIGQYPTAGLGGGVGRFFMPDDITVQITQSRAVDTEGNIHIEGIGVVPDIRVPVTIETLFTEEDVILTRAIAYLNETLGFD